jgi:hypothetical protein
MANQRQEAITAYGLMFGEPVDCTLQEIDRLFRDRPESELVAEAGFGITVGTGFDRAYTSDDPRTMAIAAVAFGPVALELDRRGIPFPHNEDDRLAAFEMWKHMMLSGGDYARKVPAHRLAKMREVIWDAILRVGPWGQPIVIGSLLQSLMVVDTLLGRKGPPSEDEIGTHQDTDSTAGDRDRPEYGDQHPVSLFIAYAHKDSKYRDAFISHLSPLRRQGKISEWYDRKIDPGQDWKTQIDEHLEQAEVIVPLISADFISSDYAYGIELQRALEKHKYGSAIVVPVVIKPVHWHGEPFADLQMLPADAKPVTQWRIQDNAWVTVIAGIERAHSSVAK